MFEKVIVVVSDNPQKRCVFTIEERMEMIRQSVGRNPKVEVDSFSSLLVDYLKLKKVRVVIRGLRAVSDLEHEFQMASMNRSLYPEVETVFLMPDENYTYLSSSMVREIAALGASLEAFVTPAVAERLKSRFPKK